MRHLCWSADVRIVAVGVYGLGPADVLLDEIFDAPFDRL